MTRSEHEAPDYLWDPSAAPDPEIERLERALAPLGHRGERPDWPAGPRRVDAARLWRRRAVLPAVGLLAAGIVIAVGVGLWTAPQGGWEVERLAGEARLDDRTLVERGTLRPGGRLATGTNGRARLALGLVGEVELEPEGELALVRSRPHDQHFHLAFGTLRARIWAPPQIFQVDTPAARAIDLGCVYELTVDRSGDGRLAVISGWVALVEGELESFVPAGAWAPIDGKSGPGVPLWQDAPEALRETVGRLQRPQAEPDRAATLEAALTAARERDALTLWHLLARAAPEERQAIAERLSALVPAPPQAHREAILAGDRAALDAWWNALELGSTSWWRLWRQPARRTGR